MKKKVVVLSLGGSLIIPDDIDVNFLKELKKVITKNNKKYKFIVVCGGGNIARKYISALKSINLNEKIQSLSGISATRMNARFMSYFFNVNSNQEIPTTTKELKKRIIKEKLIFSGALEYKPKQTSDSTAAEIASHFKSDFINLTNVQGLFDKNPIQYKNAKQIPKISWKDFDKRANEHSWHLS